MPKVGRSKFPYTSSGIKAAKKFAKMTGQKMMMDPDKMTEKVDNAKEEKADKKKSKKKKR